MKTIVPSLIALAASFSCAFAQEVPDVNRPIEDDVIYFMLPDRFANGDPSNDRGGMDGNRLDHGFEPTHKGFFHGGDLRGLTEKLDYIQGLGATAIWLGPIYKNKPVQGPAGDESAGYHGYWITDFTDVDPHYGTREDLKTFVDAAHARGMKVILDIITNHTADVFAMRECHDPSYQGPDKVAACSYRSEADYPYTTRGGPFGDAINEGFEGIDVLTEENFAKLTRFDWAYTPYLPEGEENAKTPAWLNDPRYYHHRGDFGPAGESFMNGDFSGLDDLMTEHPRVVEGMIQIFGDWIEDFGIDGFRIDTARHVRPEFWQEFVPAMKARAESVGKDHFAIFGEVYDFDPEALARHTRQDRFPSVIDFAFQGAVREVIAEGGKRPEPGALFSTESPIFGTRRLARVFEADVLYEGGEATARQLPIFLGNHDMGRFSSFIRDANPDADEDEIMARLKLAHVLLLTARGVPTLYSGSEQGFISDGNDQLAREDMFPSLVAVYNDNDLLGTDATTAESNFDTGHPLYEFIGQLARTRAEQLALRRGRQVTRYFEENGGLFAFSRIDEAGTEILVALNVEDQERRVNVKVDADSTRWESILGRCSRRSPTSGTVEVTLPPLGAVVCKSQG